MSQVRLTNDTRILAGGWQGIITETKALTDGPSETKGMLKPLREEKGSA
jgi:hypothetical protein